MRRLILIAHNVRSCHNVGSLFRTAEGLGVEKIYLTGYTPHPAAEDDERLPHEAKKISSQIHKTALGAETLIEWQANKDVSAVINTLSKDGWSIMALEQSPSAMDISRTEFTEKVALVLGNEVEGIDDKTLSLCDMIVEIPMSGNKESFNVVQAAAMALFSLRFN